MSKRLNVLHQHSPAWGLPTFDPFCLSAYAYMRFTGVEFSVANGNNPGISTTGSLPALEEGERLHCGLDAILDHLEKQGHMPHSLTAQERADVAAFSYLVQSKLHNIMLYNWWADKNNRGEISRLPHFNSTTFPLSVALPILRTRKVMQDLEITFHTLTDDHVYKEASACCRALSDRLGTDPYFHGSDRPGRLDAVVVGHLAVMLMGQLPNPKLREIVLQHNNLVRFCKRVLSEHLDVELDESKLASSSSGSTSAAAQSIFRQSYRKQGVVVLSLAGLALLGYYAAKRVSADDFASSVPLPSSSMTELLPS